MARYFNPITGEVIPDDKVKDCYHFHKDCIYYEQATIETVYHGKQKRLRFKCPMMSKSQDYVPRELNTIKWECLRYEPKEPRVEDFLK